MSKRFASLEASIYRSKKPEKRSPVPMLNTCQLKLIQKCAYIPEHLPWYLHPFSGGEPCFDQGLLYYKQENQISVIAAPLARNPGGPPLEKHIEHLAQSLAPTHLKIISPAALTVGGYKQVRAETDFYYCLNLKENKYGPKQRNMLKRAAKDACVRIKGDFTREHLQSLVRFIRYKELDDETARFFHHVPEYVAYSGTAVIIEGRSRRTGDLIGFNIMETGARWYDFYLFNITGEKSGKIPGMNDLLLQAAIGLAKKHKKRYINMGLGINKGISAFKTKWGARPFLPYYFQHFQPALNWRKLFTWR